MTTMAERLVGARVKIDLALQEVRSDEGASPVLLAVVNEFASKAEKAVGLADQRTAVIELEQAGGSTQVGHPTWTACRSGSPSGAKSGG